MSWAIWVTGLPGSGKSVLARGAAEVLRAEGSRVVVLELDRIRKVLTPAPSYTEVERDLVYRALGHMAALLVSVGVPVIVDATAHRRVWRELVRRAIPRFAEVQLECPLDVCRAREAVRTGTSAPEGIYARAGAPGATVPGVDVAYEPAVDPELTLDTATATVPDAIQRIVALARVLSAGSRPAADPCAPGPAAAERSVRALLGRRPATVTPETAVAGARARMEQEDVRHLPVTEGERLVGVVSDRDLRRALAHLPVGDVMARAVVTVGAEESIGSAARRMLARGVGALPVTDGGRLVGVITATDLLRGLAGEGAA